MKVSYQAVPVLQGVQLGRRNPQHLSLHQSLGLPAVLEQHYDVELPTCSLYLMCDKSLHWCFMLLIVEPSHVEMTQNWYLYVVRLLTWLPRISRYASASARALRACRTLVTYQASKTLHP